MQNAIIGIMGTAICALVAYIFTAGRSDLKEMLANHADLLVSITKTQNSMSLMVAVHDVQIKEMQNKLQIPR